MRLWPPDHRPPYRASGPELTSLAERYGALLAVRAAITATVALAAALFPGQVGITVAGVGPITLAYLLTGALTEWARRAAGVRGVPLHHIMLLVDAVYLAVIVTATGGPRSELLFLFSVHLVAVTLLGGHRTGLRIALWDSFLLVAISSSALDGDINRLVGAAGGSHPAAQQIALVIAAFWFVAVATAFFSSLNERELRGSREELRILAAMGADLEFARSPDDVVNVVLARTAEAFAFQRGAVLLKDGDGTRGITAEGAVVRDLPGGTGPDVVVDEAWRLRGPVLVKALHAATNPMLARLLPDASNVVVLPLTAEGEPLGALAVEWGGAPDRTMPVRTVTMLGQFAAHAALAARNARLLMEIERLAMLDGLTGLANRRVFDAVLAHEVIRAQRSSDPLSLIWFDVDHFKAINDTLGHQAGDEVLRQIGRALTTVAREVDLVARCGGEEFAAIVPGCSLDDAVRIAERMRAAIAACAGVAVTVSAGAATLPTNAFTGGDLLAAADEALYVAKHAGRDRVSASFRRPAPESVGPGPTIGPASSVGRAG